MKQIRLLLATVLLLLLASANPELAFADVTKSASDDSFVRVTASDTNFDEDADEISVTIEGFPTPAVKDIGYFRFNLSNLSGTLTTARLRLYDQAGQGSVLTISVYSTTSDDWNGAAAGNGDETTLTFNNAPVEDSLLDSQAAPNGAGWIEFTSMALTTYVNNQLSGDKVVTFRLRASISSGFVGASIFEDRENGGGTGNEPELVLEGVGPTAVTLSSFTAKSSTVVPTDLIPYSVLALAAVAGLITLMGVRATLARNR
jgi:hypothetical protein